ncbi:PilZ domain-containing protein [Aeoliella sp.]|uniref:PilZ domain-containing protein n=1 Tax=Aeoliella sp. TaxID=2795800 RepID=UPI003CCC3BC4
MLGSCGQEQLTVPAWESIADRARLPLLADEYLDKQGPMPVKPDSRRGYHRMYLRSHAVMLYGDRFYAAYLSDVSRTGAGFYSPVQLLPASRIQLWLADGRHVCVTVKNCVRLEDQCYRCGAEYLKD